MRKVALIDLSILGVVFWSVWSLRFIGVTNIGLWSMLAGVATGTALLRFRKQSWSELGLHFHDNARFVVGRAAEFMLLTFVVGSLVIGVATMLGFPPTQSTVLTNQPDTVPGFLLDMVFGVWVGAAIGEELFFRGLLLSKFRTLFGSGRAALAVAVGAQAVWFGAGHISQGISGMVMAGTVGAAIGVYFLTRARASLLPLIVGHGMVDTLSQSLYFFR